MVTINPADDDLADFTLETGFEGRAIWKQQIALDALGTVLLL